MQAADPPDDNRSTMQEWTRPYGLIDSDHPSIVDAAATATQDCTTDEQKAIAIHRFVRDRILFGFSYEFDNLLASKVLQHGRGFCNPKSTLFVAMLRAAGIPARQHMVSINMKVLSGLGPPTDVYGDHAISEVYLDGRWLLVDSYTVDKQLYSAGMREVQQKGLQMGYGVHLNGVINWDGKSDSFVQYIVDDSAKAQPGRGVETAFSGAVALPGSPASDRDFGVVKDLRDFCHRVQGSPFAGLRSGIGSVAFGLFGGRYCNWLIGRLRSTAV